MSYSERSIKSARDRISGKIFNAEAVFQTQSEGFTLRHQYNTGEIELECPECNQKLSVPNSRNDNVFFRHYPNSEYCILKEDIDKEILNGYYESFHARESDRHKELKIRIGSGLAHIARVDQSTINVDTKYIIRDKKKRRPDVYCVFNNLELAFEIQLSSLPLNYIIHRHQFYKKHGIYLIWIIDTKDPRLLSNMQRDIKRLNSYQNIFCLDETSDTLRFNCSYKFPFIYENIEVRKKWNTKSVSLEEVKFSSDTIEPYYFDYPNEKLKSTTRLNAFTVAVKQREIDKLRDERIGEHKIQIQKAIGKIKNYKDWDYNFYPLNSLFIGWDYERLHLLNSQLGLKGKIVNGEPVLNHYIKTCKSKPESSHISFVEFLIVEDKIELDINTKNDEGIGCLQCVYQNKYLEKRLYRIVPAIFKRGYILTEFDRKYFQDESFSSIDQHLLQKLNYYNALSDRSMAAMVAQHFHYLLFIESALQKKIIGSNLKTWTQYIVGFQGRNKEFWYYSKLALVKNGTWDLALAADKKGTIEKKIIEFDLESFGPTEEMTDLLAQLYPQLFS